MPDDQAAPLRQWCPPLATCLEQMNALRKTGVLPAKSDTNFALGQLAGQLSKTLALLRRDIADLRDKG